MTEPRWTDDELEARRQVEAALVAHERTQRILEDLILALVPYRPIRWGVTREGKRYQMRDEANEGHTLREVSDATGVDVDELRRVRNAAIRRLRRADS